MYLESSTATTNVDETETIVDLSPLLAILLVFRVSQRGLCVGANISGIASKRCDGNENNRGGTRRGSNHFEVLLDFSIDKLMIFIKFDIFLPLYIYLILYQTLEKF